MCVLCALSAIAPAGTPSLARDVFPAEPAPFPWPDGGQGLGGRLTWTGVAGFVIEAAGSRIALDPFVSRPGLFATLCRPPAPDRAAVARAFAGLAAVFVGHTHFDHAMDLAEVAAVSPKATLYGSRTTVEACRRLGVPPSRLVVAEDGSAFTAGPFRVEAVRAAHGVVPVASWFDRIDLPATGMPRTPFRWPRGEVFAWRVEVGGRSFHVQGSAGIDDAALSRQARADVLVACLAARKGTPHYLGRLAERLRPKILVPCHHDDFFRPLSEAPLPVATLRWDAFLSEAADLERVFRTRVWLPVRGVASPI